MDRELTQAFRLNGITYVPHYLDASLYVGPGYNRYNASMRSADELRRLGATPVSEFLWPRPKVKLPIDL